MLCLLLSENFLRHLILQNLTYYVHHTHGILDGPLQLLYFDEANISPWVAPNPVQSERKSVFQQIGTKPELFCHLGSKLKCFPREMFILFERARQ